MAETNESDDYFTVSAVTFDGWNVEGRHGECRHVTGDESRAKDQCADLNRAYALGAAAAATAAPGDAIGRANLTKRWIVTVQYDANTHVVFDIEELFELDSRIEEGPDWDAITDIRIVPNLARREGA